MTCPGFEWRNHDGPHTETCPLRHEDQSLAVAERRLAAVALVLDVTEWNDWPGRHRLEQRIRAALVLP